MNEPIAEHDVVALVNDLPQEGLAAGQAGAVVHVYASGAAYEVEFPMPDGGTVVATVERRDLLKLKHLGAARRIAS